MGSGAMSLSSGAWKSLCLTFGLGIFLGWWVRGFSPKPLAASTREQAKNAFFLGVKVRFPSDSDLAEFERIFAPLAAFVEAKELGTASYILMHSDKEPRHVMILERYKSKDYYLNVHRTSPEFRQFREKFQEIIARGAVVAGDSYIESDVGFM